MILYMVIACKPSFSINFSSGAISFQILKYFYYCCARFLPSLLLSLCTLPAEVIARSVCCRGLYLLCCSVAQKISETILGAAIGHGIFESGSSFCVGQQTAGGL